MLRKKKGTRLLRRTQCEYSDEVSRRASPELQVAEIAGPRSDDMYTHRFRMLTRRRADCSEPAHHCLHRDARHYRRIALHWVASRASDMDSPPAMKVPQFVVQFGSGPASLDAL